MEDRQIVDLYWARSENAISETERKYVDIVTTSPITFYITTKIARNVSTIHT